MTFSLWIYFFSYICSKSSTLCISHWPFADKLMRWIFKNFFTTDHKKKKSFFLRISVPKFYSQIDLNQILVENSCKSARYTYCAEEIGIFFLDVQDSSREFSIYSIAFFSVLLIRSNVYKDKIRMYKNMYEKWMKNGQKMNYRHFTDKRTRRTFFV